MALNVKRERTIGASGFAAALIVGWHEGWNGSLASCTAAMLALVSLAILMVTVPTDKKE